MIEFSQLFYFRTVAQLQHITKAAEALHVSQPNLSNSMSRLEASLGVPLFERSHGKIRLGEYGKIYLKYVEQALDILDSGEKQIQSLYHQEDQTVQFASCSFTASQHQCMRDFMNSHPHISLNHIWLSHKTAMKMLEENEVDFAITSKPDSLEHYDWYPLVDYEVYVGVSERHRLWDRDYVDISELKDEPMVGNNLGADRRIITHIFDQAGLTPKISYITNDDRIVGEKLQQEKLMCLIPDAMLYDVLNMTDVKHVHPVRILGVTPVYTIGIVKRKDCVLSVAAKDMVEILEAEFPKIAVPCQEYWKDYWAKRPIVH